MKNGYPRLSLSCSSSVRILGSPIHHSPFTIHHTLFTAVAGFLLLFSHTLSAEEFTLSAQDTVANLFQIHGWIPKPLHGSEKFTSDTGVFRINLQGRAAGKGRLLKKLEHSLAYIAVSDVTTAWYGKPKSEVKRAFRTTVLAQGDLPYVVVIDDVELLKPSGEPLYMEWLMPVADSLNIQNLHSWMHPDRKRHSPDLYKQTSGEVLLMDATGEKPAYLFARVVHLPSDFHRADFDARAMPSARFEQGPSPEGEGSMNRIAFVARGTEPRFIIILAPKEITATWARGKDKLSIAAGIYADEFTFLRSKDGTTSIRMDRRDAGSPEIKSTAVFSTGSEDIEMLVDEEIKE